MSRFSMYLTVMMLGWASLPAMMAAVELKQDDQSDQVILSNEIVSIAFNMSNGMYTITDIESGQIIIDQAGVAADSWGNADGMRFTWKQEEINDALGHGRRLMVEMEQQGNRAIPVYLFSFALYDGRGGVFMGFGMRNTMQQGARLMRVAPMLHARLLEGKPLTGPQTLNGAAGADIPRVEKGLTRACPNSLLLTCMADGIRLSLVWGGLANREFGKWVALHDGMIEMLSRRSCGPFCGSGGNLFLRGHLLP